MSQHRRGESMSTNVRKISFSDDPKLVLRSNLQAQTDYTPKIPSPLSYIERSPQFRPKYQRTVSTKGYSELQRARFGHRRTQSCTTPGTQANHLPKHELRRVPYNRSSSNIANTREYYAAPAYNEAALLERKESMRLSKKKTEDVIE